MTEDTSLSMVLAVTLSKKDHSCAPAVHTGPQNAAAIVSVSVALLGFRLCTDRDYRLSVAGFLVAIRELAREWMDRQTGEEAVTSAV